MQAKRSNAKSGMNSKTARMLANLQRSEAPPDTETAEVKSRSGRRRQRRRERLQRLASEKKQPQPPPAEGSIKHIETSMPTLKTVDRAKQLRHIAYFTKHLKTVRNSFRELMTHLW